MSRSNLGKLRGLKYRRRPSFNPLRVSGFGCFGRFNFFGLNSEHFLMPSNISASEVHYSQARMLVSQTFPRPIEIVVFT